MQDRTGLTVFLVRVVFVLFETRRFCKVARFVFPDLRKFFLRAGARTTKKFSGTNRYNYTAVKEITTIKRD